MKKVFNQTIFQKQFDLMVYNHLHQLSSDTLSTLRKEFMDNQVVVIESLLPEPLKAALSAEARFLMAELGKRRDLVMKVSGNTPRHYWSVGRDSVNDNGKLIPAFFHSEVIRDFLTFLNGNEEVYTVPYKPEEFIINRQQFSGDTHGWHWDDYTFALIWVVEAPELGDGGLIEYVPNTTWDKSDFENCVSKVLEQEEIQSMHVPKDNCYFMKASTTLHRVAPLNGNSRRTVIVFTYASENDFQGMITHESMEEIYPDDTNFLIAESHLKPTGSEALT